MALSIPGVLGDGCLSHATILGLTLLLSLRPDCNDDSFRWEFGGPITDSLPAWLCCSHGLDDQAYVRRNDLC